MPAQSGNNEILEKMRRGYTREAYLELVDRIRDFIPEIAFSSDFILGFCGETEEQYQDTVSLVERVRYHIAYVYAYSLREKTAAHRRFEDDVPQQVKLKRVDEVMKLYRSISEEINKNYIGDYQLILVEGDSKRSGDFVAGRNDSHVKVIVPKKEIPSCFLAKDVKIIKPGDYICVAINDANAQTLKGEPMWHTTLQDHYRLQSQWMQHINSEKYTQSIVV